MQKKENADCEVYHAMLFDYVSDNLSEQDKAELLMHIESCPECKNELCETEAIMNAASELDEIEVPDDLRAAVSASLAAEAAAVRKRISIRKYALRTILPVAACAALAVGIYSGGIYDRFVNSDNIISEGNEIQMREGLPEADAANQAAVPEAVETPAPQISENNSAENAAKSTKPNTSAPIQSKSETKSNTEANTKSESVQTPSVPETSAEKATDTSVTETAPEQAPSSSSAGRASGGGSAANGVSGGYSVSKSADTQESAATTDNSDIALASAEEQGTDENTSAASSVSCTIIADNPVEFAEGFGISGKSGSTVTFRISQNQWREFVNYCRGAGVQLDADFSGDAWDYVDITVESSK